MKNLLLTLLCAACVLGVSAQPAASRLTDEQRAQQWFAQNDLSQIQGHKVINFEAPARTPFVSGGDPTGTETGITNPEGTHYDLAWSGNTFAVFQEVKFTGYCGEMVKSADGRTVYFMNIMPDFQTYWLMGEIDAERNVVVIPNDQLIYEEAGYKCYFVGMPCQLDDYGYATQPDYYAFLDCGATVEVPLREDGGIDATGLFFWLWSYAAVNTQQESDGFVSYCYSMVSTVVTEQIDRTPEGMAFEDYFFNETNISYGYDWADTYGYMGGVARDGDDLYLKGINSMCPASVVKLTVEGEKATLTSNRVMTDGRFYYTFDVFNNVHEVERESNGYTWTELFYDVIPSVDFIITPDAITIPEGCGVTSNFLGGNPLFPYWYVDIRFDRYEGNEPATPMMPEYLRAADFWEYGFANVSFYFTCQDANSGKWINPRACFYEVYFDGAPYTFTSELYNLPYGDTSITKIPVLYDGGDFEGYDEYSMWQGEYIEFLFRDKDLRWNQMQVRIGYTDKNGDTTYSGFATYDNPDPNTGVETAETEAEVVATEFYNLQGMAVAYPAEGQVCIRVRRMTDGTSLIDKFLSK